MASHANHLLHRAYPSDTSQDQSLDLIRFYQSLIHWCFIYIAITTDLTGFAVTKNRFDRFLLYEVGSGGKFEKLWTSFLFILWIIMMMKTIFLIFYAFFNTPSENKYDSRTGVAKVGLAILGLALLLSLIFLGVVNCTPTWRLSGLS